MIKHYINDTII